MSKDCKYLNECLENEIMACYDSPETCDIFRRKEMSNLNMKERVAEIISEHKGGHPDFSKSAAAEIMALLEAENKTLSRVAHDLDVPLWKAMKIAATVKKEIMEMVKKAIPEEVETNDHIIDDYERRAGHRDGYNECRAEFCKNLGVE